MDDDAFLRFMDRLESAHPMRHLIISTMLIAAGIAVIRYINTAAGIPVIIAGWFMLCSACSGMKDPCNETASNETASNETASNETASNETASETGPQPQPSRRRRRRERNSEAAMQNSLE